MSDLTSARAYLQSSVDPSAGAPSLHAHLSALLQSLIRDRDPQPLRRFEELSVQLKQQRSKEKGEKQGAAGGVVGVDAPASSLGSGSGAGKASALAHLQRCVDLIKPPKKINEDGEEEEEEEGEANPAAPDLQEEAFLWQQTGVGLTACEWARVGASLQRLCDTEEGFESPRFWGKVYGTRGDYYVLETKLSEYPDDEEEEEAARLQTLADSRRPPDDGDEEEDEEAEAPPSTTEPWGTGANEYVYYAANSPDGPWVRLPKVTPAQIIAARGMRRFLSGSLQAAVHGFPRFPWGEASYLRTQIARITASTALCPRGAFVSDEEEPLIALENEEYRGVRASSLLQADAWVHYRAKLLGEGRVEAFVDENAEEEPDDDELDELAREQRQMERANKEKPLPILTPASSDRIVTRSGRPSKRALWKFHLSHACDQGLKPLPPPGAGVDPDDLPADESASQVVASAHSLLWPGAVSLAKNKTHLHVYVGYGLKALHGRYRPAGPAPPQQEYRAPTQANSKGVVPADPLAEQSDALAPPADQRSPEELEEEEEEERARLKRLALEDAEPEEEIEDDEEEHNGNADDDDDE